MSLNSSLLYSLHLQLQTSLLLVVKLVNDEVPTALRIRFLDIYLHYQVVLI